MTSTAQLGLPLLMPAQAQKHVIVNEALIRLDAIAQLRVVSAAIATPPEAPRPGESYLVPPDADGEWAGHQDDIATYANGDWLFIPPRIGWQAWDEAAGARRTFDGRSWVSHAAAVSPGGAGTLCRVDEVDHVVHAGERSVTDYVIPPNAIVLGVTGRVVESLEGEGLLSWRLGVDGAGDRYGSGLGAARNAFVHGVTGSPVAYYQPTPLLLTAEGGSFDRGRVRLAVHLIELAVPRPE